MSTDPVAPRAFDIRSNGLRASVSSKGAELLSLQDEQGRDLLWNGDPAFWSGRAPLLFPIVGRLKDNRLHVEGRDYPMKQHGIARQSEFDLVSQTSSACCLRFKADERTREAFPYDFDFEATFSLEGYRLGIDILVRNIGSSDMPVSMGFHPAFRWPLPYGGQRDQHEMLFEKPEPETIRKVVGGLLSPDERPTPVEGNRLPLADHLFEQDALIWLDPHSRNIRYGVPGSRSLTIDFPLMPDLGIWSKPGAGFVCVEPWSGYASPEGFDGEFKTKPGLVQVRPGAEHRFGMSVTLDPP